ncbi:MAG: mycofactocin precursor MftA, partial [Ilumatobacter sp.]|nr:mycofactocin precursor MftA [Ilumatobacter sp.]
LASVPLLTRLPWRDAGCSATACSSVVGAGYSCVMDDIEAIEVHDETDELVEEELLVEEISIDGMCGVY